MRTPFLIALLSLLPTLATVGHDPAVVDATATAPTGAPLRAQYLTTVADDFVVEVYHNGHRVPDEQRHLFRELFGATAERIDAPLVRGDWLVFHVVHNRLRWGGARYFAVTGAFAPAEWSFVSDPASPAWSACDDPARAARFIRERDAGTEVRASPIALVWGDGDRVMRECVGGDSGARPLWGGAPSTWLKVRVE